MAVTALDTSVIIAGLVSWHEDHSRSRSALETALAAPEPTILPVHALLEAYSVITRLPPPRRLTPNKARTLLSESLRESTRLVGLGEEGWSVIEELADRLIGGGMTYDAAIVASARKAEATRILTLNGRHFKRLTGADMEIREPEEPPKEEAEKAHGPRRR